MKKMFISLKAVMMVCLIGLLCQSCKKGEIQPYYKQIVFYADYLKPATGAIQFNVDYSTLPKEIQIPANSPVTVTTPTGRVNMTINNVRLKDGLGVYNIVDPTKDVVVQELRNGVYEKDVEMFLKIKRTQNLDVVLVLDFSSSLGSNLANVKNYATTFIDYIQQQNTSAKIGVVIFSNTIVSLTPTPGNFNAAKNFIYNQPPGGDETKLYEAMDKGISLFQGSTADGKALVTFTDGKNNSTNVYTEPGPIVAKLNQTYGNPAGLISSYTIGLNDKQGSVDEVALNSLALNGGSSAIAPDVDQLEKIFKQFSSSVSAVYTMTYDRNNSTVANVSKLRFVVNTQLQ